MNTQPKCLAYFDQWMDPTGAEMAAKNPGINLAFMDQAGAEDKIWETFAGAHGYQMRPSTETQRIFWPDRSFLARCPNLLAVSSAGAGYDIVDVEACTEAGILVVNQSGSNAESVAQHVIGMMLALAKQMIQSDRAMRRAERNWTRWDYKGHELTGRTVGIVGLGNVGRRVAELSKAFNMQAIAYDPYITDEDFRERGADKVNSLDELFQGADIISVNCPLTDETHGMIGAEQYALMKSSGIFITTARGFIHDETALTAAIADGRIAAAGCDVFGEEPPAHDHPLLAFDNVIVSPHNAGVTSDCNLNMAVYAVEQWGEIFAGRYPSRLQNPDAWDRYKVRFAEMFGVEPVAA